MRLSFARATPDEAAELAALRTAASRELTSRFGRGHWSGETTERGVGRVMQHTHVGVVRHGRTAVATFSLGTRKPWAIDRSYFTPVERPLYLTDMAVHPEVQRQGVGRLCIEEIVRIAHAWPADALRLDAYDAAAGAGGFYARCGFREVRRVIYRGTPLVYYELLLESP